MFPVGQAYNGLCAGLRGVSSEVFSVCLGVCAELDFAVFVKINVPVMSVHGEIAQDRDIDFNKHCKI